MSRHLQARLAVGLLLGLLLAGAASAGPGASAAAAEQPQVVILATGGTIAGAGSSETDAGYRAGTLAVETLIKAVPEIALIARVRGEQIANVGSQDMSEQIWLRLAHRVNELLAQDDIAGIVITHGTDTMEETAYLLHLVVRSAKPVVLTGAMRPATALGADGPRNLYAAVAVAADPEAQGRGVLVVINDDIHGARGITKTSTTDLQTFRSPEHGLIGVALADGNHFFRRPYRLHTLTSKVGLGDTEHLPKVEIIAAYAGMDGAQIEAAVKAGAKGIVVAGVGNGNMSQAALTALAAAAKKGIACVRSSRVSFGFVGRNVETDDDALGLVAATDLNPQKARILLSLALLQSNDPATIQQLFDTH